MHDMDRIQAEYGSPEVNLEWGFESGEGYEVGEAPLSEIQGLELASKFLGVTNDEELDHFLGDLFKKVSGAVGGFVNSPAGQAIGGILKSAARQALPMAGKALGTYLGGPVGGAVGSSLASTAGQMFGLELGEMSPEDRTFEVAKSFVNFAADAVKRTAQADPTLPPLERAKQAAIGAAQQHAPGLVQAAQALSTGFPQPDFPGGIPTAHRHGGRWVRQGRNIILLGV